MTGAATDRLLGELIGLARATEGNEHLITAAVADVAASVLCADDADSDVLLRRIDETKRAMIPDCFACASPCGRNNAHDLSRWEQEPVEIRELKQNLLALLRRKTADGCRERALFRGLIALGIEGYAVGDLEQLLSELNRL